MINQIRPLTAYRLMMIGCSILLTGFFVMTILAVHVPDMFGEADRQFIAIFAALTLIFSIGTTMSVKAFIDHLRFLKTLELENSYTLGVKSTFYNLDAFKLRIRRIYRRSGNLFKGRYLIAFTPTSMDVVNTAARSHDMMLLNQKITQFLDKLFTSSDKNYSVNNHVYAFNHGVFLVYCFTNDELHIHDLINKISNECFRLVNEENIKIWAQPFYGINRVEKNVSLTSSIENALIARSESEKNYESYTYFRPSFIKTDTSGAVEIQQALDNHEFIPYYQAKYSLKEKQFISCEVLARWKKPDGTILGPGRFIDKAGKAGLLSAIDNAIFEAAVKDMGENLKRGRRVLPLSINFSLYEFFSRNFLNHIVDTLQKYQVPPSYLEVEITETTSLVNKFLSLSVIKKLKDIGVRVLMDDFGMGYSQIENLRQIPFDGVKIDKSFTDKILEDEKTRTIVHYLIELIHANDMEAIIEGVETKEQVDALKKMKADTIQGFFYTRPIDFERYNQLLKSNEFEKKEAKK